MSEDETERLLAGKNGERLRASVASFGMWQPIETAPKDGTTVLVWPVYAMYSAGEAPMPYAARFIQAGYWVEAAGEQYERVNPTHWQHLPEPPAT